MDERGNEAQDEISGIHFFGANETLNHRCSLGGRPWRCIWTVLTFYAANLGLITLIWLGYVDIP